MPDPFEALRTAPTPIDPDPSFAVRLRRRVQRAFQPSSGASMVTTDSETSGTVRQGDMSYISLYVSDIERAENFYSSVLGWKLEVVERRSARQVLGQSLPHGLASIEPTRQFLTSLGLQLPRDLGQGGYVTIAVDDVDAAVERVRAAGGQSTNAADVPYGRMAQCVDNQGLLFALQQRFAGPRAPASGVRQGDVAYLVFEMPDAARARTFYSEVLGWQFTPGRVADGWNITDTVPMSGLAGGRPRARIVPMYRVDDIQAAVQRVRASGGTATDPVAESYGIRSECADDQGTTFYLGQL